jgi:UPF0271 protein
MHVHSDLKNIFMRPDINCDLGEGLGNDALIMPFISSANIACGYHAGNTDIMQRTVELCLQHKVNIGAHPSYLDREHFGRKEIDLPVHDIYELITQQLMILKEIADGFDAGIHHVKPHGALYNMSARDPLIAQVVAKAVRDFDDQLTLFGLSGSYSISEAQNLGLKTMNEVFADRRYNIDGSLVSRNEPHALISDVAEMLEHVKEMIREENPDKTICIHGDGEHAVEFAKAIHQLFYPE